MQISENKITNSKLILYWFLVWTSFSLLQTVRVYYVYNMYNNVLTWQKSALWAFSEWYLWGLLSILIIKIIQRLDNNKNLKTKIIYFFVGLIIIPPLHLYLYSTIWFLTKNFYFADIGSSYDNPFDIFTGSYLGKVNDNSVAYFLIVAAIYAYTYYKRLFLEQQRLAELNKMLVEAKLEHLKTQFQPHFLFNTLNTITALIHSDPDKADLMTTKLSDLLRISLDSESTQEVTLLKEITFLEKYLDIQKVRFDDRMEISIEIDDSTKNISVPYLILQPIVENAIKHSVAKSSVKITITIKSEIKENNLMLTISNSGNSLSDDYELTIAERTGLKNSIERLKQLYNENAFLTISNMPPSGVIVTLKLPINKQRHEK